MLRSETQTYKGIAGRDTESRVGADLQPLNETMSQTIQHLVTISHSLILRGQLVDYRTGSVQRLLSCQCTSKARWTFGNRASPPHGNLNNNLKTLSRLPLLESSGATFR